MADLESELRASQQQVASQLQELTDLRKVTEDLRDHAHEARKVSEVVILGLLQLLLAVKCDVVSILSCHISLLRFVAGNAGFLQGPIG